MRFFYIIILLFLGVSSFAQTAIVKHLMPSDFQMTMDSCVEKVIFDIRPESFSGKFIIEGAIIAANRTKLESILDTLDYDTPLFFYCVEGMRSKDACEIAQEKGFTYIFNLKKGVYHYKKRGYPVFEIEK